MKNLILSACFVALSSVAAFTQNGNHAEKQLLNSKGEPVIKSKDNAPIGLKAGEKVTRGAALASNVKRITVAKAFAEPANIADKTFEVEGVIIRSCRAEGCWMEMADKEGGKSVRVTFGDDAFFIPLNAGGMKVRAQGTFKMKVLDKDHVDHLIKDDGAKFDIRNADGTVTEVSFDATGVELIKM